MTSTDAASRIAISLNRTLEMFIDSNPYVPSIYEPSRNIKMSMKINSGYKLPVKPILNYGEELPHAVKNAPLLLMDGESMEQESKAAGISSSSNALTLLTTSDDKTKKISSSALALRRPPPRIPKPQWHAPWELSAVVSGHLGWVRSITFDPSNEWFATGSSDRTIKIWDFAKCCAGVEGGLKLTLTGHISAVRGLRVSSRHPYLFSAGEDKLVKCWDLEQNKVVRNYHGHLSGVYTLELHPTLDLLITGGRDSVARVWDIRTKHEIHVLAGHSDAVATIATNSVDPQIITGSHDSTIKLWDLAAGRTMTTLTQHKKAVRGICVSKKEFSFVSAGSDSIKKWQCRDGTFLKNFNGHNSIINCIAVNEDGVCISGADDGTINFWDYDSGYCFQKTQTIVQPGSLDAEAGIFASTFDLSGSRFITCEADKTIKIWKENSEASEDSHPIDMDSWTKECLRQKRY